jgi:hypothetical protein
MYIVHIATCCTYRILFDHGYGLACMHACQHVWDPAVLFSISPTQVPKSNWNDHPSFPLQSAPFSPAPRHRSTHTGCDVAPACHRGVDFHISLLYVLALCLFFFWKGFMPFNKEVPITGSTRRSTHGSLFYSFFFLHKSPFGHFVNALHAFEILCW